jgi:hypothetical protein
MFSIDFMQKKGFKKYFFPIQYLKLGLLSVGLGSNFFHYLYLIGRSSEYDIANR